MKDTAPRPQFDRCNAAPSARSLVPPLGWSGSIVKKLVFPRTYSRLASSKWVKFSEINECFKGESVSFNGMPHGLNPEKF